MTGGCPACYAGRMGENMGPMGPIGRGLWVAAEGRENKDWERGVQNLRGCVQNVRQVRQVRLVRVSRECGRRGGVQNQLVFGFILTTDF